MPVVKKTFSSLLILSVTLIFIACSDQNEKSSAQSTKKASSTTTSPPVGEPTLTAEVLIENLSNPWDIGFVNKTDFLFTERTGKLNLYKNGQVIQVEDINDVKAKGEGGLLGLAVDSNFEDNSFIYICYNSSKGNDVRVSRFVFNSTKETISNEKVIVSGITAKDSGRHSGCRVRSASNGHLFIGTGDAANSSTPQNPKSLAGKILRVNRNGEPVEGNLSEPFDPRIFNYGHRNVQGIALFEKPINNVYGFSVEHGSDVDDEVNLIENGNFGWAPTGEYNEDVPMTDLEKFPNAKSAVWSSGRPTIAPSGATLISGKKWGIYDGALAVAVLKGEKIKFFQFNDDFSIASETDLFGDYGRIRSVVQGKDGNLYFATDDSSNGKIVKVVPSNP